MSNDEITPPPGWHSLLEGRVGAEASALMLQLPMLRMTVPRGSGPVMVLPGFMTDDSSTWLLRRFLSSLGYTVAAWEMGLNRGPMMAYLPALIERLDAWRQQSGEQPSLVGWSRGGTLSREIARERPDLIRTVVTMGSPVRGGVGGTSIGRLVTVADGDDQRPDLEPAAAATEEADHHADHGALLEDGWCGCLAGLRGRSESERDTPCGAGLTYGARFQRGRLSADWPDAGPKFH